MTTPSPSAAILSQVAQDLKASWRRLFLTDITFKLIAFVALTPLVGLLFRVLLAASGDAVLSDVDIVRFFVGPAGWLCAVFGGGASLGVLALEQAALLAVIASRRTTGASLGVVDAVRFAAARAAPILRVTARIVWLSLLAAAPFLAGLAGAYFLLLREYDINYYLQERPPAFKLAIGIGAVLMVAMAATLLRLFSSWVFALPIVLFEDARAVDALRLSRQRAAGRRIKVLLWAFAWLAASMALSAMVTACVGLIGRSLVPRATASLHLLAAAIGVSVIAWALLNLATSLLSTAAASVILLNLYSELGASDGNSLPAIATNRTVGRGIDIPLNRTRLVAALVIGVLVALAIGVTLVNSVRLEDQVKIMAHRGASTEAPENTLAAIEKAIAAGADFVEIDVQETADDVVVVFHDSDMMKLAGSKLKIWESTLDELQVIDIGSWFDPRFGDERVPTLAEVLDLCKGKIHVNIELKYYGHDKQLVERVADLVDSRDMGSEVVVMSLNSGQVRRMRALKPDWKVGQVMSVSAGNLKRLPADFLAVNASFVNRNLVR
ncbi:MAG: glycerophosphoryl diester phosphodiesterase membrane domain-containing protein, partial [Planctomycetales bacterium]|nr:glycerophosphoryl diester phosphodiesterase membrane domain-containing protein [Planctomycetales bacterium]